MMKKLIAVLLSLVLLACSAAAVAENMEKVTIGSISINGDFTLQCGIPEGYKPVPLVVSEEQIVAMMQSEDPQAPVMMLSVAYDETYSDVDRMNDLDKEALDLLEQTYIDNDPDVEITYGETGYGTMLMIARHETETQDFISFLSIYKGYFIEFVLSASEQAEDKNLTEEQLQMSIAFLTDLDFIPGVVRTDGNQAAVAGQKVVARLTAYDPADNTVQVEALRPVTLNADALNALAVGDTLNYGQDSVVIETLEKEEDTLFINGMIELRMIGDEIHVYEYDQEIMQSFAAMRVAVPEDLVFLDGIDPETGESLDEPSEHTAAELTAMLSADTYPDFASENVYATFDDSGALVKVERFYTPWQ